MTGGVMSLEKKSYNERPHFVATREHSKNTITHCTQVRDSDSDSDRRDRKRKYASCPVCYMSDARTTAPEDSSVRDEAQPAFEST